MIPDNVSQLVAQKFVSAKEGGHIHFLDTESTTLKDKDSQMEMLVSYTPNLQKKPEREEAQESKTDPFASPEPELTVLEDLNEDNQFKLLLNKYPVIPNHVLLVTKEFKHQNTTLTPPELYVAYKLLTKMDASEGKRHMVFYNSGPNSGSSQDHKHLQMLAIPDEFVPFQDRLSAGKDHFLPDFKTEPLQDEKMPFAHFLLPLPQIEESVDEDLMAMTYFSLLQRTLTFFQDWTNEKPQLERSYNFLLTKKWMCLVPRSSTKAECVELGFNSVGYAGLVLVKKEDVYKQILEKPELVNDALLECGFPSTAGQKPTEYHY
ncbi:Diadenosine 5',5'''-P1,P4-tetraphosphate phosphorylase 2 [Nakaseomyces bracarensis]|uniref:Diadenosine 5',5'''-P1,P4-tetraphosphate phosphorylase 2 n=1 Tax=Nakaseomyces bracarensis TaxID=273131 RepID=A0ABR4NYH9_9SACH